MTARSVLNPVEIDIWYLNTEFLDPKALRNAESTLSCEELARRDRLQCSEDRRDFTMAHDLLRRSLSRYGTTPPGEWQFHFNTYGKPFIDNSNSARGGGDRKECDLSVSLSHTRGFVACAIASTIQIGLDVERVSRSLQVNEIAEGYFSQSEATALRGCPDDMRAMMFVNLWTLKEAFLKAVGVGLSGSLASASFELTADTPIRFTAPEGFEPHEWHFALFEPEPNTRMAVAARCVDLPRFLVREARVGESEGQPGMGRLS